ncbi:bifunctional metallophosphatase/5'-nucleotidase [Helcococcus massiliensis]|uniref:bifunctional metallophosphatase/5'-nucleotidase n=1 Tax=Helcococcus massiliensis TaxID=2040290 RepID=UPI000CDE79BC|nr:5'-nucleotidase C-terminal domain-containing protein [Helcococcus massiliensis]
MNSSKKFNALLSLLLVFALVLGPVHGVFAQNETGADDNKVEIKVLYMNDVHGRISFDNSRNSQIGYGKMKTYYDSVEGNKLLLDIGDSSQGTVEVNLKKGAPTFALMGLIGVDASVLGNHEFDFSYDVLKSNIKLAGGKYPILGSNIIAENGERPFDNHLIKEFDGVKVGIFGIDTPETKYKANPLNTKGLEFEAPVVTAKRKVAELKKLGADIIICMTHLGIDGSTKLEERGTYVLEQVDGIDLLLDGHSHTIGSKKIGNGYYAQAAKYSELLGEATLTFDKTTKKVSVENQFHHTYTEAMLEKNKNNSYYADFYTHIGKDLTNIEPDAEVEAYIAKLQNEVEPLKKEVVGESQVHLEGISGNVRTRQTNLSTIIADAMRKAGKADVALTNGGGIRDSIQAGKITKGDVLTVLPFGNTVTVIKVTGQKIYEALKHGTDSYPAPKGAYPQVSNMTFDILTDKDGKPIDVVNIKIGGEDIDLKAEYTLATNDFMAVGGDGYTMFEGAYQVGVHEGMAEIVMDYIKELSPITLKDEDVKITNILVKEEPGEPTPEPIPDEKKDLAIVDENGKAKENLEYKWTEGKAKDIQIRLNAEFGTKVLSVKLNGKDLKVKVSEGSTIVHIAKEDLAELKAGKHNLEISLAEGKTTKAGTVKVSLVVEKAETAKEMTAKPKDNKGSSPKTGDISLLAPIALLAVSTGGFIVLKKGKKEDKLD